jgi:cytidylate kinase
VAVITVYRQAGCGGRYIAESLARELDYHLVDYRTVERIIQEYGLGRFKDLYGTVPDFWERFTRKGSERDELNTILRSVTLAAARHGNTVMLGRGCFAPLQGMGDVLNVRVKAPLATRIGRIMHRLDMTHEEATAFIEAKDRLVADFSKTSYDLSPDDARLFDLVIDTSKVDQGMAVRWIVEAVGALKAGADGEVTAAETMVDPIVANLVSEEFECGIVHGPEG